MKKTMLIISALLLTSICWAQETVGNHAKPNKQLQESGVKPGDGYTFAKGDTIVISKSCTKYLTGETPSTWVYYVKHIVEQQGGKRFPNGILIRGIYSWVGPENLLLAGPTAQTEAASAKKAADKKSVVERQEEVKQMPKEEQQVIAQAVKEHEAVAIEEPAKETPKEEPAQVAEEPAPVVVAPVVVEEPAPVVVEEPAPVVEEAPAQVVEEAPAQVAEEPTPVVVAPVVVEEPAQVAEEPASVVEEAPVEEPAEETKADKKAGKVSKVDKMPAAQFDRFNIGLRGGVASVMQKANKGDWKVGGDILLDLQYAHYWKRDYKPALGLIIGASVGYSLSPIKCGVNDKFTVDAGADGSIDYAINVDEVKEKDGQIQVEVPVMFSLITDKGFFFNVGPRFMLPVWKRSHTDIKNAHIQATLPEGITVKDNVVTGILNNGDAKNSWKSADINIMLTCELGYEWKLANGHALELGVYADYSVYSKYSNTPTTESFINVTIPSEAGIANASARALTDSYANKLGYFDAGIKLTYCFNFWKTGAQLR